MEARVRKLKNRYSGVAAVVSFVTQPVPALDELVVVPIHYGLVLNIARARRIAVSRIPWRAVQKIIWYGAAARLVGNFSLGLVPVVGMFSNAITAIALTEYLAWYLDRALDDPSAPAPDVSLAQLKDLFASAKTRTPSPTAAPPPPPPRHGSSRANGAYTNGEGAR